MARLNEPIYNPGEKKLARILQRAAELQERDRERGTLSSGVACGVSLSELKQIAGEVGISPRYVEAAAAEAETDAEDPGRFFFWGAPVSSQLEQTIQGEVPAEEWESLVASIRRSTGNVGRSSTLGQALEWTGQTDLVSISAREGETSIRSLSRHVDSTLLAHLSALLASGIAIVPIIGWLHGSPLEATCLYAVTVGGMFGLARGWARAMYRSHRDKMRALLQELADHVAQTAPHTSRERSLSEPTVAPEDPARAALSARTAER